jgi:hypothetical protein
MAIFKYFLLTLLLELPIVLFAYRSQLGKALMIDILLNLFTWPLITLLYINTNTPLPVMEMCVFIIEGIGLKIFLSGNWTKAMFVSFLANGFSWSAGMLISKILPN